MTEKLTPEPGRRGAKRGIGYGGLGNASQGSSIPWKLKVGEVEHTGEIVVADRWATSLGQMLEGEQTDFRIVILTSSSRMRSDSIKDPRIAVWLPSQAVAEEPAAYQAGKGPAGLNTLLSSSPYLQGRVYTSGGLLIRTADNLAGRDIPAALDRLGVLVLMSSAEEYLRLIVDDLPSPMSPQELESVVELYRKSQERLREDVQQVGAAVHSLSKLLDSSLIAVDREVVDRLQSIAGTRDPVAFGRVARDLCGSPSSLASDLQAVKRLIQFARLESEIRAVHLYLSGVSLGKGSDELSVDVLSIMEQLKLDELAARPHLWSSVQDMFRWFKSRYIPKYQEHHRDYYREMEELYYALNHARPQVEAVGKLNGIPELRVSGAEGTIAQYEEMLAQVKPCPIMEVSEVVLEDGPTCPDCGLALSAIPPSRTAREYLGQLREMLEEQCRRLSVVTTRRILANKANQKLERLVQVVQVSDLTSLANVLDDELVELLRDLLREPIP